MSTIADMNTGVLRILVVDDDEEDYLITRALLSEIEGHAFDLEWVADYDGALETMGHNLHDVCLLDYRLGGRDGLELLREAIAVGCKAPIILFTGQGDHNVDVEAMRAGAMDYLTKGRIDATILERSIRYAFERNRVERQREGLIRELEDALAKIKTLSGLLPICASCKSIRDDKGYWNQLETYIHNHSDAEFSHGLCPHCMKQMYPRLYAKISSKKGGT